MSDRQLSDPLRFLLRALVLLALMLALWWLVLLNPLLAGLRLSAEWTLRLLPGGSSVSHVIIGPDRSWTFQVPAPAAVVNQERTQQLLGAAAAGSGRIKIRSMKVEGTARYPILFTVSLPLFWAILLAAPGRPRLCADGMRNGGAGGLRAPIHRGLRRPARRRVLSIDD